MIVALGWGLAGCYDGFESEQAQLHFNPGDAIVVEAFGGLVPGQTPVLEGTEVCATMTCSDADTTCPRDIDLAACFDTSVDGGTLTDDGCAIAEVPGTFVWHFDPLPDVAACGADPATYTPEPDAVTFEVVAATEVTPHLDFWAERFAASTLFPAEGDAFPDDWTPADGEPLRIVEGGVVSLPVAFTRDSDGQLVAWDSEAVDIDVVITAGLGLGSTTFPSPGTVQLTGIAGGEVEVRATYGAESWVVTTALGVAAADAASIEIVVAYDEVRDGQVPFGARAVLRDASGNPLFGAPVAWTLTEGDLVLDNDEDSGAPGKDYVLLGDACTPPPPDGPDTRSATLEAMASLGSLTGVTTFTWTAPTADPENPFVADRSCDQPAGATDEEGCACEHGPASPWGVAPLFVWLTIRRQRRR